MSTVRANCIQNQTSVTALRIYWGNFLKETNISFLSLRYTCQQTFKDFFICKPEDGCVSEQDSQIGKPTLNIFEDIKDGSNLKGSA